MVLTHVNMVFMFQTFNCDHKFYLLKIYNWSAWLWVSLWKIQLKPLICSDILLILYYSCYDLNLQLESLYLFFFFFSQNSCCEQYCIYLFIYLFLSFFFIILPQIFLLKFLDPILQKTNWTNAVFFLKNIKQYETYTPTS